MKKILLIAIGAVLFACTPKHDGYTITGTIDGEGVQEAKVYLSNFSRTEPIKDTADLVNGKFEFKGKLTTPEHYAVTVEGMEGRIVLFLENEKFEIAAQQGDFANATVTGGATNEQIKAHDLVKKEISERFRIDSIMKEFYNEATTPERKNEIIATYQQAEKEMADADDAFFAANPTSFFTITQLIQKVEDVPLAEMEAKIAQYEALPQFAGNRYLNDIKEAVTTLKGLEPGMQAPEFTLNDPDGNPVSLSSVYTQHKVTMIDFWAGWCGPCRRFNPTLVEIYKKYNKDGFGIIGVSLDSDENVWKNAIKDDKLTWAQVSDLQYWNSAPAKLYYVRYIPQNIFVDAQGKIIKRKVSEEEMESFLEEQLGL
jgi:thiol-disulfide isomerase/thioredoxin